MNPNDPSHEPMTEAELHAYVDGRLTPERHREIEAHLARTPDEAQRAQSYRDQKRELHALFDPVLDEALPQHLRQAAQPRSPWYRQRMAAGVAIALLSGAAGWGLRGGVSAGSSPTSLAGADRAAIGMTGPASVAGFAQRAAVAHAVYSPEQRRPVEVDAAHEDQLVAWLSKRMGAPMKPPHLQVLGYALEGGRLLPGGEGPVAQFMYRQVDSEGVGGRLTLYVSNEVSTVASAPGTSGASDTETAFRFAREGQVNVFYWVDGRFGYAISADADRAVLGKVSEEVYRQVTARR